MAKTTDESTPFDVRPNPVAQGRKRRRAAEFDRICVSVCELAAALFDLPMAFLSLYEDGRLTPVSAFGIPDIEVLDTLAFTARKLVAGEGLRIDDATHDARYFLESAVLRAPHMRFYADMPLVHDGEILGVIAIADAAPGEAVNLAVFAKFADQVATLLSLAQGSGGDMRSELQAQQRRMDMAAEMAGFGYWTIDLATREVIWSKALYALLGLNEKTYVPQVVTQLDIYAAEDRSGVIERFQRAVNAGEDFDFELRITRRKDKAARLIRTKGGVEYDGDGAPVRLCAVVRDVTETGVSDDFLGHVTDELRAPLNEIVNYARLIETRPVSGGDIAGYARNLLTSAEALQSLIGDTLVSEPAATDEEDEIIDLGEMIRETVDAFTLQAEAAQTRLSVHFVDFTRATARLDVMRIQQVLQNLISNACKFTRGGVISVTASQVTAENPQTLRPEIHLHVSVRDSGVGMDEALAHNLFTGGKKGLGLSIAQTIVEMLGGHIGAVSRPGEGANVWFEIPVEWAEAPAAVKPDPKAVPVPRTLARQSFDRDFETPQSRPAYAPLRPRFDPDPARHAPVDEDRINREYLRALLQDMKLDL
ncbi:sensor histidine kinase [Asticcacaulis sp.]|uniref:sensor histidine kinase n=1 Tax=Asticcacaulis sp. TaxID=1872648 RepID=UPI002CB47F08|nr:ATP-binding protein [Asticcacaulis sp.]HTM81195.1 ATP-binding protein [Asticcacaulis sp.]